MNNSGKTGIIIALAIVIIMGAAAWALVLTRFLGQRRASASPLSGRAATTASDSDSGGGDVSWATIEAFFESEYPGCFLSGNSAGPIPFSLNSSPAVGYNVTVIVPGASSETYFVTVDGQYYSSIPGTNTLVPKGYIN